MQSKIIHHFIYLLISCLLIISSKTYAELSYQDFAQLPNVSSMGLSPNGDKIFAKVHLNIADKDGNALEVTNLLTNKKKTVLFTDNKKYDINWVQWKNNHILLVGIIFPEKRTVGQLGKKYKTRESRLMIINTDTNQISTAFSKSFLKRFYVLPLSQDNVIDSLPDDDEHILIALKTNKSRFDAFTLGVYKLNIINQKATLIEKGIHNASAWQTDRQHRLRLVTKYELGTYSINLKDLDSGKWRTLWTFKNFSEQVVWPMGFAHNPNILFVKAYHQGRLAIFKVNLQDKDLSKQLLVSDEKYDINGRLIYNRKKQKVLGVTHSQMSGYYYFDSDYQQLQQQINKAMPKTNNRIVALSEDQQKYLVFASSDIDSGTFLYGTRNPASLNVLAYRYQKLSPELMAPVKKYNYLARDGLQIEAFLTLPLKSTGKNLPTVLFPHGGPISQDSEAFNYWAQYLAHQGYAVLQMNYRGSSGQGLDFMKYGLKNWGLAMQDDIQDGARQLISDGISQADKICIAGASYGGYAALMSAVKTPDFYQCAISFAGVSNVVDLVSDNRRFWSSYNVVDEQIGNDRAHLHDISPANHAKQINIPILLIHGDSDRQVNIKHSQQMYDALVDAKKNVTYLVLENEDHFLTNNKNRLKTFAAIEQFLSEHLPVNQR